MTPYKPADDSPEILYMHERRKALGGYLPVRNPATSGAKALEADFMAEFRAGSGDRALSTTMACVAMMTKLMKHPKIGKNIVPIVPDEARTFGMDWHVPRLRDLCIGRPAFTNRTTPTCSSITRNRKDGQILEEGITEAGSMAEFTAAGTAYANYGIDTIPFTFTLIRCSVSSEWATRSGRLPILAAKASCSAAPRAARRWRAKASSIRTGIRFCSPAAVPNLVTYDPAFAFELAVIIRDGIRRMYENREDIFYYLTLYNENYVQTPMPDGAGVEEDWRGLYLFRKAEVAKAKATVQLLGSGSILNEAVKAQHDSWRKVWRAAAEMWSATSYNELRREGPESRTLEHPASRRTGEDSVRSEATGEPRRARSSAASDYVKNRTGSGIALAQRPHVGARHGRLRPAAITALICAATSK